MWVLLWSAWFFQATVPVCGALMPKWPFWPQIHKITSLISLSIVCLLCLSQFHLDLFTFCLLIHFPAAVFPRKRCTLLHTYGCIACHDVCRRQMICILHYSKETAHKMYRTRTTWRKVPCLRHQHQHWHKRHVSLSTDFTV